MHSICNEEVVLSNFGLLLNKPEFSDVVLIVKQQRIHAHRCVLAVQSQVFASMFYGKYREAGSQEIVIDNPNIYPEPFLAFLKFLYTGHVQVQPKNVLHFLYLSSFFAIEPLEKPCKDIVKKIISPGTALTVWDSALTFGKEKICQLCRKCAMTKTNEVIQTTELQDVTVQVMLKLLACDEVTVQEIELFQFAHQWIQLHKPSKEISQQMMSMIRFPIIPPLSLVRVVKPTHIVRKSILLEAFEYQADPSQFEQNLPQFRPRYQNRKVATWLVGSKYFSTGHALNIIKVSKPSTCATTIQPNGIWTRSPSPLSATNDVSFKIIDCTPDCRAAVGVIKIIQNELSPEPALEPNKCRTLGYPIDYSKGGFGFTFSSGVMHDCAVLAPGKVQNGDMIRIKWENNSLTFLQNGQFVCKVDTYSFGHYSAETFYPAVQTCHSAMEVELQYNYIV